MPQPNMRETQTLDINLVRHHCSIAQASRAVTERAALAEAVLESSHIRSCSPIMPGKEVLIRFLTHLLSSLSSRFTYPVQLVCSRQSLFSGMLFHMPSTSALAAAIALLYASSALAKPPAIGNSKAISSLTWGPLVQLGPTRGDASIIGVTATSYPGNPPSSQAGGLFNWIGINNYATDGDLIQSIVGQYSPGQSECSGSSADREW